MRKIRVKLVLKITKNLILLLKWLEIDSWSNSVGNTNMYGNNMYSEDVASRIPFRRNDNVPYNELYVDPLLYFTFHILLEAFNKTPSNLRGRVP